MDYPKEFKTFLLRGNVVELAVAFVMGVAFAAVITSLVENLITPLIAMVFGERSLASLDFEINDAVFGYGLFLDALLTFVAIAAVVFFFIVVPMNMYVARSREEPPPDPTVRKCPECLSDIPAAATRCAFCTAVSPAAEVPAGE